MEIDLFSNFINRLVFVIENEIFNADIYISPLTIKDKFELYKYLENYFKWIRND